VRAVMRRPRKTGKTAFGDSSAFYGRKANT